MNKQLLRSFIQEYKEQFHKIHQDEIYKWKAVKQFQDYWDIDSPDFYSMLKNSLYLSENLLTSFRYYPKQMLLENAEKTPQKVRSILESLYDETTDLLKKIEIFNHKFSEISEFNFPEKKSTYQDDRAILVYLNLKYPERHYLYKYTMFEKFSKKFGLDRPIRGRSENIGQYYALCRLINHEIEQDQELLKLHKNRITDDCYFDKKSHILTQDFIFFVANNEDISPKISLPKKEKSITPTFSKASDLVPEHQTVNLTPKIINHLENSIENKHIGDLGEQFVLEFEKKRLQEAGKAKLANGIEHISRESGDGAGYDILSFNEDGSARFIEVKTTKGNHASPIYITRNELVKSIREPENYFLYRVYKYSEITETGELNIIKGDLTPLCNQPISYKVVLRSK